MGIQFIETCLDEAYNKARPNWERARYFRFPYFSTPKGNTRNTVDRIFTELGLISVGATSDSKDFKNEDPKKAYESIHAGKENNLSLIHI